MPTYTFRNKKTRKIEEHTFPMSEYDSFVEENTHLERCFDAKSIPSIVSGVNHKPDSGFRDVLKTIKKGNPGSKVNTF